MSDVSNRTIVALLAVALVVSVAGTMYSVSELGALGGSYNIISGAATSSASGTTDLFISSVVGISTAIVDGGSNDVTLGSGNPVESTYCNTLNAAHFDSRYDQGSTTLTTGTEANGASCWEYASAHTPDSFIVSNTGNTDVNVTIKTSNSADTGESIVCGDSATSPGYGDCTGANTAKFAVHSDNEAENGCDSGLVDYTNRLNIMTSDANLGEQMICGDLDALPDSANSVDVYVSATLPSSAALGSHSFGVTFTARDLLKQD